MARPKRDYRVPRLSEYRTRSGLTQQEVADSLGSSAELVRKHERGIATPGKVYRVKYCALYGATEDELGLRPESTSAVDEVVAVSSRNAVTGADNTEEPLEIYERIHRLGGMSVSDEILTGLQASIHEITRDYEDHDKASLAKTLIRQRRWIDKLVDESPHPRRKQALYRLASQTSGILGYIAVNRGKFSTARAYCMEAFQLGDYGGSTDLQAWARGTQSFCEFYAGDFIAARDLARDGLKLAGTGVQGVRLAINGEARALGKLGDVDGVHRAVDMSYALMDGNPAVPGVSSPISFGGYSLSRTASNAVTAYVPLRLPNFVQEHADIAMPEFEVSESRWSQSLLRLDLANSIIVSEAPDVERGCALVAEALAISRDRPITSVIQRSREFIAAARRWNNTQSLHSIREALRAAELR